MEKEFVSFAIALALKEKGFEEPCFGIYDTAIQNKLCYGFSGVKGYEYNQFTWGNKPKVILAPLHQQVIDWFRTKHYYDLILNPHYQVSGGVAGYMWDIESSNKTKTKGRYDSGCHSDYHKAMEDMFTQAITLI